MVILDGKNTAEGQYNKIKEYIEDNNINIKIAVVLVGNNHASQIYVRNKIRACEKCGIQSVVIRLGEDITEQDLLNTINNLNKDTTVTGYFIQLPLPKHINVTNIINNIDPNKDIDGFHPINLGKLMEGDDSGFVPATPLGILTLLNNYNINLEGKHCVIIGRSNIVGKPLANLLINKGNCTVTVLNTHSNNIKDICKTADVLISAIGKPLYVTEDYIKQNAVVIDVGINRDENGKLCGDIDYENVKDKCSYITPVPGGVGPMTICGLIINVLKQFKFT